MPTPFPPNEGPQAPERNPPIHPEYFLPKVFQISNLLRGVTTLVTTTVNHDYVIGQLVRLLIPPAYGSIQLNERTGLVINIPTSASVVIDIDSKQVDAFNPSPILSYNTTVPQIVAVGDANSGPINSHGRTNQQTFINGSFINISPI